MVVGKGGVTFAATAERSVMNRWFLSYRIRLGNQLGLSFPTQDIRGKKLQVALIIHCLVKLIIATLSE